MEKETLKLVLLKYKSFRCLWDNKSNDYNNKTKRLEALKELLEIYVTIQPNATIDTLKKKIEFMRACFLREYKKWKKSKLLTNNPAYWKVSRLWYYKYLLFLKSNDAETQVEITAKDNYDIEITNIVVPKKIPKAKRCVKPVPSKKEESQCRIFGKTVGLQLEDLSKDQQYIAQKLISDVIFNGRMNKLSLETTLHNPAPIVLDELLKNPPEYDYPNLVSLSPQNDKTQIIAMNIDPLEYNE